MVARGEIYWASLGPDAGRRPICVLTRDAAIELLHSVVCAPITRTVRGIRSEVEVGTTEGLSSTSAINCDNIVTISKSRLDDAPIGRLGPSKRVSLDAALRYALGIAY